MCVSNLSEAPSQVGYDQEYNNTFSQSFTCRPKLRVVILKTINYTQKVAQNASWNIPKFYLLTMLFMYPPYMALSLIIMNNIRKKLVLCVRVFSMHTFLFIILNVLLNPHDVFQYISNVLL